MKDREKSIEFMLKAIIVVSLLNVVVSVLSLF